MGTYRQLYERSLEQPEAFWAEAAEALHWDRRWDRVLDADKAPFYRWFAGGTLNTCFNAVDRHVASGRGGQPAIIHDSPVTGTKRVITYAELKDQVSRFAGALVRLGVRKGDRVIVYMPMVPEALIAMLACARIGAVHSVVFGGFASPELATRIDDAKPKVVVSASCGMEGARCIPYKPLLDKALDLASHKVAHCVVLQRPQATAELRPGRDLDWHEAVAAAHPVDCVPVAATDPLYILYTSGTTGQPKGVVRDNGGHAVALLWTMRNLYGVEPGEVFWSASDVGWVVGHSYIVYGPLLNGNTTIVYEGKPVGTPDPGAFWRVASEHKVGGPLHRPDRVPRHPQGGPGRRPHPPLRPLPPAAHSTSPASAATPTPCSGPRPSSACRSSTTGGRPRPAGASAATRSASSACPSSPARPPCRCRATTSASSTRPGGDVPAGHMGAIAIRLPLPPGCLPTLWNADERYRQAYLARYPGHYLTGDAGYRDEDGYLFIMSRTDDVINVAGHRLSTGAIEEVLASHQRRGRVRRHRRRRPAQGRAAARPRRPQGRRRPRRRGDPQGAGRQGPRPDRPRRRRSASSPSSTACRRRARARSCAGR